MALVSKAVKLEVNKMSKKTMVIYYSWSGTTAIMAKLLQKITEGDLTKLKVDADTFSNDMNQTSEIAKQQLVSDDLPEVQQVPSLETYDLILVGGPVWSGQVATPVRSFLKQITSFNGVIIPFYTSVGSDDKYETDFKKLVPNLTVETGLGMTAGSLDNEKSATKELSNWVQKL